MIAILSRGLGGTSTLLTRGLGGGGGGYVPPPPFVADLVGFLLASVAPVARWYPGHLPRKGVAYPAGVYSLISGDPYTALGGATGTAVERYQLDTYSPDHAAAARADDALRKALSGYRGTMGRTLVREAWLASRMSGYEPFSPAGDSGGLFRFMTEYSFTFDQPTS